MLSVFVKTLVIYIILTVSMKILGKRRIGELEADELVSTLLLSEISAMSISEPDIPILYSILAIVFISGLEVLLSSLKTKWRGAKHILEGEPAYIIYKGRLLPSEISRYRVSVNEVLAEMRSQGIGSIDEVYYGIIEPHGKLSLLARDGASELGHPVIIDGEIRERELNAAGKSIAWLKEELGKKHVSAADILLMSLTDSGKIHIVEKEDA